MTGFDRVNLCRDKWSTRAAREAAIAIMRDRTAPIVLLGAKVTAAFMMPFQPFTHTTLDLPDGGPRWLRRTFVVLPHPSGLNRIWQTHNAFERAREVLREAGVLPAKEVAVT